MTAPMSDERLAELRENLVTGHYARDEHDDVWELIAEVDRARAMEKANLDLYRIASKSLNRLLDIAKRAAFYPKDGGP